MGRHSAPDDEDDGDVLVDSAVEAPADERPTQRGRHARQDEDEVPQAGVTAPPVGKGDQPTAADLELLRSRPDVRNRVIAAVLAPFVVYTIVMVVVGSLGAYLLWVWLPLVTAGVLAGSILDAAHRKGRNSAGGAGPESGDDETGG
jgi:hypothetical protein